MPYYDHTYFVRIDTLHHQLPHQDTVGIIAVRTGGRNPPPQHNIYGGKNASFFMRRASINARTVIT